MTKRYYRQGFWTAPYTTYQCANCGVKFSSSYPRFVKRCPSCGAEYLGYVEK